VTDGKTGQRRVKNDRGNRTCPLSKEKGNECTGVSHARAKIRNVLGNHDWYLNHLQRWRLRLGGTGAIYGGCFARAQSRSVWTRERGARGAGGRGCINSVVCLWTGVGRGTVGVCRRGVATGGGFRVGKDKGWGAEKGGGEKGESKRVKGISARRCRLRRCKILGSARGGSKEGRVDRKPLKLGFDSGWDLGYYGGKSGTWGGETTEGFHKKKKKL